MAINEPSLTVPGCRIVDRRDRLPLRAGAGRYPRRDLAAVRWIVIHYSAVDRDSSAQEIATYQTTKADGDAFPEVAYHFVVRQNGLIEQCHDVAVRAWHAGKEGNDLGIAVCLPMLSGPTVPQVQATARLVAALRERVGRQLEIVGHKDLMPTLCPGADWPHWKGDLELPTAPPPRQTVVDGIPIKWAFYDWHRRLEALRPGLVGPPLGPHRLVAPGSPGASGPGEGGGYAVQQFAGCEMRWQEGRMWICFLPRE
ncbi:MAG: peptidoglycan recognition protein family protein [Chloroflexota bacterium]